MFLAAFQDGSYGAGLNILQRVGHPRGTSTQRIVEMPREGHHAPAVVVSNDLLANTLERYSVEVTLITQLDMSEVEAQ